MKETQAKHNYQHLTPETVIGQRYAEYYNYGWDFIKKEEEKKWRTINEYPISPREIWDIHQDPHQIIGLRFGSTTKHITLDIDVGGIYHPINDPKAIKKITEALETIGLCRHVCIQSSYSEGIHLIFALSEAQETFKAACLVKATLEAAGLEIKSGQLEVFPNPKRFAKNGKYTNYNGVRLPLQPNSGSYLLDDDLNIISDSVEDFLDQMDWAASGQDLETFSSLLDPAYEEYKGKKSWQKEGKSKKAKEWENALEKVVSQGWSGYHQTNYLLQRFVAYFIVFHKLVGVKLREAVTEAVINAPGYNQWCRHQHEIDKRIEEVCYYTERNGYYLSYCQFPDRSTTYDETYNPEGIDIRMDKREEDVQKRLIETVAHLEEKGELPEPVAERRKKIIETGKELFGKGFSIQTLSKKKYLVLWHPKHRQIKQEEQNPIESQIESPKDPQNPPKNDQIDPPQKPTQSDSQSEIVQESPLYEVFVSTDFRTQKNFKTRTTKNPKSAIPTDPPFPDARIDLSDLPENLPDWLSKRIESYQAAQKSLSALGLSIPDSLKRLGQDLRGQIEQFSQSNDESITESNQPTLKGKIEAIESQDKKSEDTGTESSQSTAEKSEEEETSNQLQDESSSIDENQSLPLTNSSDSTESESEELSDEELEELFEKCEECGIEVNSTIEKLIRSNSQFVVLNALEVLKQHQSKGQVKNPAGLLVKAIKQKWKPTKPTTSAVPTDAPEKSEAPSESSCPYLSNPMQAITQEFSKWYERAIYIGLVENIPVNHLPLYQHREPMVRVLTPDGIFPYDLIPWTKARDIF